MLLPSYACATRGCPEEALPVAFQEELKEPPACRCCGKPMARCEEESHAVIAGMAPASREG